MKTVKIEMNENQARLLINICDFYGRIGILQWRHILDHPAIDKMMDEFHKPKRDPRVGDSTPQGTILDIKGGKALINGSVKDGMWCKDPAWIPLEEVKLSTNYSQKHFAEKIGIQLLNQVKELNTGEFGEMSFSIASPEVDDSCRVAFDIQEVIRHELWKQDEKRSRSTVDSNTAHHWGKEPLIKCEVV